MSVLAVLGRGVIPAETPFIRADDLGLTRGDGIFETMHVRQGAPWLLPEHLARLAVSASRLDLTLPPAPDLADLVIEACAAWGSAQEGAVKLVCTRGPDGLNEVTCFATVNPIAEASKLARDNGIDVVTLAFGYAANGRAGAPWLLGGVKSLSYAANMASLRWATAHSFHDALWISSDGYVLEAPTSSVVWVDGFELCTIPPDDTGILAGTTAQFALDNAEKVGLTAAYKMITVAELLEKPTWLLSSGRGVARIRTVDGITLPDRDIGLRALLGF